MVFLGIRRTEKPSQSEMARYFLLLIPLLVPACQSVSIADQAQLSKPAMSFDNSGARLQECGLTSQIEKGRTVTGISSGGGCASCH